MVIGRVVGSLVSTQKNAKLEGTKLLLVQPLDLSGHALGGAVLAIDSVDAGVGDRGWQCAVDHARRPDPH